MRSRILFHFIAVVLKLNLWNGTQKVILVISKYLITKKDSWTVVFLVHGVALNGPQCGWIISEGPFLKSIFSWLKLKFSKTTTKSSSCFEWATAFDRASPLNSFPFKRLTSWKMKEIKLKFMFSKNATKIDKIFTVDLTLCSKCQIDGEDFFNFCGLLRKHEL